MNVELVRWGKFNIVGVFGFAVQMGTLAVLHRALPGHDLWATAAALEVTLLHNFLWHARYTWRESDRSRVQQILRFHAANGVVSMAGNLGVVRLLKAAHWPLPAASVVAIVCCAVVNFVVGGRWVFAPVSQRAGL